MTDEQMTQACLNIGYDLTCGACAALFYTGTSPYEHDPTCQTVSSATLRELLRRAIVEFIEPMGISHLTKDTQWRAEADAFIKKCLPIVFGRGEAAFTLVPGKG